jgi:hypothetical protein
MKSEYVDLEVIKATADVAADRPCLRCRSIFWSEGFGERICPRCRGSAVWRSAVSEGNGRGRRRSGGRLS